MQKINGLVEAGERFVVATVIETSGSSLGKPGFKAIVRGDRVEFGTLGGACPDGVIVAYSKRVMETGEPRTIRVHLEEAGKGLNLKTPEMEDEVYVETFCGGTMEIFLEPYLPGQRLIITANGGRDAVLDNLVLLGKMNDFEVWVIDDTPVTGEKPDHVVTGLYDDLSSFDFHPDDFVVLLTKGARDTRILRQIADRKVAYTGLLASRKRVEKDRKELLDSGTDASFVSGIHWPVGLDIGAKLPAEIAVSIMGEIISVRRKHGKLHGAQSGTEMEAKQE